MGQRFGTIANWSALTFQPNGGLGRPRAKVDPTRTVPTSDRDRTCSPLAIPVPFSGSEDHVLRLGERDRRVHHH